MTATARFARSTNGARLFGFCSVEKRIERSNLSGSNQRGGSETGLRGKFQFIVRKDVKLTARRNRYLLDRHGPQSEPRGSDEDRGPRNGFITQRFPRLSREMIASVAVDYHVTQVVDGTKGVHGMVPKAIFAGQ